LGGQVNDVVVAERDAALAKWAVVEAEAESWLSELTEVQNDLATAESQLSSLEGDYEDVSMELSEMKKVYPPGDFTSVTELESWVRNNTQSYHEYLDETFRSALTVQSQGLEDGYLISVVYDEDDTDPNYGWIYCGALVNGVLYMWDPEETEVYSFADYDFIR